ncbi:MAG: hypothetical protein AVDCRST_MAG20-1588, partial [uncultured Acidimicrobiales bacterium]
EEPGRHRAQAAPPGVAAQDRGPVGAAPRRRADPVQRRLDRAHGGRPPGRAPARGRRLDHARPRQVAQDVARHRALRRLDLPPLAGGGDRRGEGRRPPPRRDRAGRRRGAAPPGGAGPPRLPRPRPRGPRAVGAHPGRLRRGGVRPPARQGRLVERRPGGGHGDVRGPPAVVASAL